MIPFELQGVIALVGLLLSATAMVGAEEISVAAIYGENSCSSDLITLGFDMNSSCSSLSNFDCGEIDDTGMAFGHTVCTDDHLKYAKEAFGEMSYVLLEFYEGGVGCSDSMTSSIAFVADGKCHSIDASFSFQAAVLSDGSTKVVWFESMYCEGSAFLDIQPDSSSVGTGQCFEGFLRVYANTGSWDGPLHAIGFYDDDSCDGPPMQLTFTQEENCTDPAMYMNSWCTSSFNGSGTSHYSMECVEDYIGYASKRFGDIPYLVVENYDDDTCQSVTELMAFRADGVCSYGYGMEMSLTLTMHINGSVIVNLYEPGGCDATTMWHSLEIKGTMIGTGACDGGSKFNVFNKNSMAGDVDSAPTIATMLPAWLWDTKYPRIFTSY